jgi:hypothetical protein
VAVRIKPSLREPSLHPSVSLPGTAAIESEATARLFPEDLRTAEEVPSLMTMEPQDALMGNNRAISITVQRWKKGAHIGDRMFNTIQSAQKQTMQEAATLEQQCRAAPKAKRKKRKVLTVHQ